MAEAIKKCTVRIGGVFYQLVTRENEQYTRQIAAHADEMIQRIMAENEHLNQTMATVLSLVNVLDDLMQSKKEQQVLEKGLLEAEGRAAIAKRDLDKAREDYWELKKEMLALAEQNQDYLAQIKLLAQPEEAEPEPAKEPVLYEEAGEDLPDLVELALADEAAQKEQERLQQTNLEDYLAAFGKAEDRQSKDE